MQRKFTRDLAAMTATMNRVSRELRGAPAAPMHKALTDAGYGSPDPDTGTTMSGEEFMEKALESVRKNHISTAQLTEAETNIREGKMPPAPLVKAVLNGTKYWPF